MYRVLVGVSHTTSNAERSIGTSRTHNLSKTCFKELPSPNTSATLITLEALEMKWVAVVNCMPWHYWASTLVAFLVGLSNAALAIWVTVLVFHFSVLPNKWLLATATHKTVHVVWLEREFDTFLCYWQVAYVTFRWHLLNIAHGAHDATGHLVELPVN